MMRPTTSVTNSVMMEPLNDELEVLAKGELLALPYVDPHNVDGLNDELEVLAKGEFFVLVFVALFFDDFAQDDKHVDHDDSRLNDFAGLPSACPQWRLSASCDFQCGSAALFLSRAVLWKAVRPKSLPAPRLVGNPFPQILGRAWQEHV
eukprot:2816096-Amphidinium_carterae.2